MIEKINCIRKNKIVNITGKAIKGISIVLILLVVSIVLVQRFSNNNASLGGYRIFTVVSNSMLPEYEIGDMLIAKKKESKDIRIGDDLVYLGAENDFKDKIVTHRIVNIHTEATGYKFHTKGLANSIEDPLVSENQVYGVVIYKSTILSFLSKIVNSTVGFFCLVFIPLGIMVSLDIIEVINEKKELENSEN